jgi:hypothetical protein
VEVVPRENPLWEYKVIRVSVGPLSFQKYGPDSMGFEATMNEMGNTGWEAFHIQAYAEGESLLLFFKRRIGAPDGAPD